MLFDKKEIEAKVNELEDALKMNMMLSAMKEMHKIGAMNDNEYVRNVFSIMSKVGFSREAAKGYVDRFCTDRKEVEA